MRRSVAYHPAVRVLLVSANREKLPSPVVPLGVLYVAGAIRGAHEVKVVDLCFEDDPEAALRSAIAAFEPEVVGMGLRNLHDNTYTSSDPLFAYYERLAACIRESTRAPLVLGGPAITLRPTQLLERLGAAHAVVGEGEHLFPALLEALARGETPERVLYAGAVRRETIPLLRRGMPERRGIDLDTLAGPARDLVDPRYFEVEGTDGVQTKRGCAFQCTYCDYPDLEGKKVRVRDPEAVADEMAACARVPGCDSVFIVDSVFNVPRSHALAVCDALIARGSPVPWVCYVSPASLDEELVARMARAGCIGAEIGADTGTQRVLERLRKPFTLDQVRRVRSYFRAHEIADCYTFVVGAEDETVEEARGTLDFVRELDPDVAVFIAFMEDREDREIGRARHREALLELLAREALREPGWIVPELGIRFGAKVSRVMRQMQLRGPGWVHLARARRERTRSAG